MRFGSGIKTKILESLYLGLPVVTTPVGAEGIPDARSCMVIAEGKEDLADAVVSVLEGRGLSQQLQEAAQRMLSDHYSREAVHQKWRELVLGS